MKNILLKIIPPKGPGRLITACQLLLVIVCKKHVRANVTEIRADVNGFRKF